jgi:hypothetical protein
VPILGRKRIGCHRLYVQDFMGSREEARPM